MEITNKTLLDCIEKTKRKIRVYASSEFGEAICNMLDYCKPFAVILKESNIPDGATTAEMKDQIYRIVEQEFAIQDAQSQVIDYCTGNEIDVNPLDDGDYEVLAQRFRDNHDCNLADNDQWQELIANYIGELQVSEDERQEQLIAFLKENNLPETAPFKEIKAHIYRTMVWEETMRKAKLRVQEYCTNRDIKNTMTESEYEKLVELALNPVTELDRDFWNRCISRYITV